VSDRAPIAIERAGGASAFSPISSTLIHGDQQAVLVDTPITIAQTKSLIKWIEGIMPGKELTYLYITHGHGDHWFGIPLLKERWPNLRAIATLATVKHMKDQLGPGKFEGVWLKYFPGNQIYQPQEIAEPWPTSTFEVEGHTFEIVEVGHTDSPDTTVLHVPDLHLVVAGDAVYGDVHQFFGEANTPAKRKEWLKAIETIEGLHPHTVVAGHKREGSIDGVYNLKATREYIEAFDSAVKTCGSADELWEKMKQLFPHRINPHAILAGAAAAFP
jgi:glyoxylase-like metal-dependent hydrolase (beta-lactamase superfamily II)